MSNLIDLTNDDRSPNVVDLTNDDESFADVDEEVIGAELSADVVDLVESDVDEGDLDRFKEMSERLFQPAHLHNQRHPKRVAQAVSSRRKRKNQKHSDRATKRHSIHTTETECDNSQQLQKNAVPSHGRTRESNARTSQEADANSTSKREIPLRTQGSDVLRNGTEVDTTTRYRIDRPGGPGGPGESSTKVRPSHRSSGTDDRLSPSHLPTRKLSGPIKTNDKVPKVALCSWFTRPPRRISLTTANYVTWSRRGRNNEKRYTSIFVDPRTGECFKSGPYGDEIHYQIIDECFWFSAERVAEHSAASCAFHCLTYREQYSKTGNKLDDFSNSFVPPYGIPADASQRIASAIAKATTREFREYGVPRRIDSHDGHTNCRSAALGNSDRTLTLEYGQPAREAATADYGFLSGHRRHRGVRLGCEPMNEVYKTPCYKKRKSKKRRERRNASRHWNGSHNFDSDGLIRDQNEARDKDPACPKFFASSGAPVNGQGSLPNRSNRTVSSSARTSSEGRLFSPDSLETAFPDTSNKADCESSSSGSNLFAPDSDGEMAFHDIKLDESGCLQSASTERSNCVEHEHASSESDRFAPDHNGEPELGDSKNRASYRESARHESEPSETSTTPAAVHGPAPVHSNNADSESISSASDLFATDSGKETELHDTKPTTGCLEPAKSGNVEVSLDCRLTLEGHPIRINVQKRAAPGLGEVTSEIECTRSNVVQMVLACSECHNAKEPQQISAVAVDTVPRNCKSDGEEHESLRNNAGEDHNEKLQVANHSSESPSPQPTEKSLLCESRSGPISPALDRKDLHEQKSVDNLGLPFVDKSLPADVAREIQGSSDNCYSSSAQRTEATLSGSNYDGPVDAEDVVQSRNPHPPGSHGALDTNAEALTSKTVGGTESDTPDARPEQNCISQTYVPSKMPPKKSVPKTKGSCVSHASVGGELKEEQRGADCANSKEQSKPFMHSVECCSTKHVLSGEGDGFDSDNPHTEERQRKRRCRGTPTVCLDGAKPFTREVEQPEQTSSKSISEKSSETDNLPQAQDHHRGIHRPCAATSHPRKDHARRSCNFVIIDCTESDESVMEHRKWSRAPRRKAQPKALSLSSSDRDFSYNLSEDKAKEMQERLFREAAARMRAQILVDRARRDTVVPIIDSPIINVNEKYPYHWKWKDPFSRLGLPTHAPTQLVKKQYRRLARLYHPDKSKTPNSAEKFERIASAYKMITDMDRSVRFC